VIPGHMTLHPWGQPRMFLCLYFCPPLKNIPWYPVNHRNLPS
jgi:hypothetical protein